MPSPCFCSVGVLLLAARSGLLHDGPDEGGRAGDSFRVGRGHGHRVGPSVLPEPEIVPLAAMLMPGGSPVAVKVRVWDGLESWAFMVNDTAAPLGLL